MYSVDLSSWNGFLGVYPWVGVQSIHFTRSGQCCMAQRFLAAYRAAAPSLRSNLS
jgi:hypothetical protein